MTIELYSLQVNPVLSQELDLGAESFENQTPPVLHVHKLILFLLLLLPVSPLSLSLPISPYLSLSFPFLLF